MTTRRNIIKAGAGLAAILASGKAPAAFIKSMVAARQGIGGRAKLPFDSVVEYIKSVGFQYIDTGYAVTSDNVRISARYSFPQSGQSSTVWGSQTSADKNLLANQWNNSWWFGTRSGQFGGSQGTELRDVEWNIENGTVNGVVGGTSYSGTYFGSVVSNENVYLFAANQGGSAIRKSVCALYRFSLHDNGVLVRDLIPVRVSGQLFGNQGTGDFVVGPDVVEVEYIESTGTQYIDTGITSGTQGIRVTGDVLFTSITYWDGHNAVFGSLGDANGMSQLLTLDHTNWQTRWCRTGSPQYVRTGSVSANVKYQIDISLVSGNVYLDVNGSRLYSSDVSFTTSSTPEPIYLNALWYNSSPGVFPNGSGRLGFNRYYGAWKFYDASGKLLRDFAPVRVGSEGAMMDRLTNKIYRNAGTGAFLRGSDAPRKMGGVV